MAEMVNRERRTKESINFLVCSSFPTNCVSKMGLKTNAVFCRTTSFLDVKLPISFSDMSHLPKRSSNSTVRFISSFRS